MFCFVFFLAVMKRRPNKLTTSYGLMVKTESDRMVLIKRRVPYCVQNFYLFLHKRKVEYEGPLHDAFRRIQPVFESQWLPTLAEHDQLDYRRFAEGETFEDLYDFPHGQPTYNVPKMQVKEYQFVTAYREFCEEAGYRFDYTKEDIESYPTVRIGFEGCDRIRYEQIYFVVKNAKKLRRCRYFDSFKFSSLLTTRVKNWNDDRLVYQSKLLKIDEAYKVLKEQQSIKSDSKHIHLMQSVA